MPMDPIAKANWLVDLRSGKFSQARGALMKYQHRTDEQKQSFCCLGLKAFTRDPYLCDRYGELRTSTLHPLDAEGLDPYFMEALARLNDLGYTFPQIADVIEQYEHIVMRPRELLDRIANYSSSNSPEGLV